MGRLLVQRNLGCTPPPIPLHPPSPPLQLLSGLCLCKDTARRGQCASASFQAGSGCWITFSPQGERKHTARAWKQIQSNVQQLDGNYSRRSFGGGFLFCRNLLRIKPIRAHSRSFSRKMFFYLELQVFINQCFDRRRPVLWWPSE